MLQTPEARAADRKRRTELFLTVVDDATEWEELLCRFEYGSARDVMVVLFLGTNDVENHDEYVKTFNQLRPRLSDMCEPAARALFFVLSPGVSSVDGFGSDDDDVDDDDDAAGEGAPAGAAGVGEATGANDLSAGNLIIDTTIIGVSSRGGDFASIGFEAATRGGYFQRDFQREFQTCISRAIAAGKKTASHGGDAPMVVPQSDAGGTRDLSDDGGDADGAALAAAEAHAAHAFARSRIDVRDEDDPGDRLDEVEDKLGRASSLVPDHDY
jgi:hypothetical protein